MMVKTTQDSGTVALTANVFSSDAHPFLPVWDEAFECHLGFPTREALKEGFVVLLHSRRVGEVWEPAVYATIDGWVEPEDIDAFLSRIRFRSEGAVLAIAVKADANTPEGAATGYLWLGAASDGVADKMAVAIAPSGLRGIRIRLGSVDAVLTTSFDPTCHEWADGFAAVNYRITVH